MGLTENAHLEVTLTTSTPTFSSSHSDLLRPFQLTTTAQIISSSKPSMLITVCTDGSVRDNGQHAQHDGLFRGAFLPLESVLDPTRHIQLGLAGYPDYGRLPEIPNLLERPWTHFKTVAAVGTGKLTVKHDLPLQRMFSQEPGAEAGGYLTRGEIPSAPESEWG